MRAALRI